MKIQSILLSILLLCLSAQPVWASGYIPDVIEFDGHNSLSFPPDPSLTLTGGSTIEFWVAPDWQGDPGYEPVILANTGEKGPSYLVTMLGNRQGLALYTGDSKLVAPFDFTGGQMQFVAIVDLGDTITVLINNTLVGEAEMSFGELPSSGFWIGSAGGERFPFVGALAGLRIWDAPLDPYDLIEFSMKDIQDPLHPHPDMESLIGISDFRNRVFLLSGLLP